METNTEVKEKTFQYQDSLPSLPVPPLQQSLDKYLESVKPFVTEEEYKHTEKVVREFGDGVGKELQAKLEERGKEHRNWLETWWEECAYLQSREPISVTVNYGGPYPFHEDIWPPQPGTQLQRMAMLLWSYAKLWLAFRREEFPVDRARALGNKPMCMSQYHNLFNICRIPGVKNDTLRRSFKTESKGDCPCNIVIFRKGYIFSVNIVADGNPVTPAELYKQLEYIKTQCEERPTGPGVGALTGWDRTSWAEARQYLIDLDPQNKKSLDVIETSIIVMVMDIDNAPTTATQIATLSICGPDVYNRWFDKASCIINYSNGVMGTNCDHSPTDAIAAIYGANYLHEILRNTDVTWTERPAPERDLPPPEEVKFIVDEKIKKDIRLSAEHYLERASNLDVLFQSYDSYGKSLIRAFQMHPDTFVQQVLQLAYFKVHRKPAPTYETATTRQFYHGRTDTVRSCTQEVVNWCKAMADPKTPIPVKLDLFKKSVKKHSQLMLEAVNGQAFDRHFLGLQILAQASGVPMPEIFQDTAWTKSGGNGQFVLSTSLVGYSQTIGGCAPLVHNGYGITYIILDKRLGFTVTAWKDNQETDVHKFYNAVVETLNGMRAMSSNHNI
ncbi:peroxisomal carnitine O-octanoyltransferase-like [Ptychodera flava]|uniref:peroxisomal carnitine O-octanoyltransferase-like n=1 Tax=Ptychodera flava TaxID=63121 RepID=UPI00396A523F